MSKVVMDVFTLDKACENYPEVHVFARSEDDCCICIRSVDGDVYKLAMLKGTAGLERFEDGFFSLVIWYYSSLEEMAKRLEMSI